MKKILSIALCAAMLLAMASIPYSADQQPVNTSRKVILPAKESAKPIKPVSRVSKPDIPEDLMEQYDYRQKNQVSAQFLQSLQKFGAKTSSMLLSDSTENKTYSPVSFAYALGMLGSGAAGETAKDIAKALESSNMKAVSDGLNKFYNYNYSDDENSTLKIANSLWMQKDFPIKSSFAKNAANEFYASSYSVDFKKQATADAMSKWISQQTGGLLNPSFQADPDQILALINTLYFEGSWANAFKAENNTEETFTLNDGSEITTTYMSQEFKGASYYETDDYLLFEVPFSNRQSMKFALPKDGKDLNSILSEKSLGKILSNPDFNDAKLADVTFKMPKFSFDSEFDLNDTCKSLGLGDLFTGKADLSGISDARVSVSNVKQESHIEVDENGCKAAAYTKMDIMKMAMPLEMEKYTFSLDRPFLFVIESNDRAPLFVGTVYNPSK